MNCCCAAGGRNEALSGNGGSFGLLDLLPWDIFLSGIVLIILFMGGLLGSLVANVALSNVY